MAKRVVTPEQFMAASFPTQGVDAAMEFWRQRSLTTPKGVNVRTEEPRGQMDRGGSRQGLVRFIDARVNGVHLIQMLDVVVDPQAPGLNADAGSDTAPPGYIPDPSTNNLTDRGSTGRFIPPHGSGRPPNRNIPGTDQSPELLQRRGNTTLPGDVDSTFTFTVAVTPGSLLVVFAMVQNTGSAGVVTTVRNGGLLDYTQVGGSGYTADFPDGGDTWSMSAWYLRAASGSSDDTVVVTFSSDTLYVVALEYSNAALSPVSAFSKSTPAPGAGTPISGGHYLNAVDGPAVSVGGPKRETVVGCFGVNAVGGATGAGGGFVVSWGGQFSGGGMTTEQCDTMSVVTKLNCDPPLAATPSFSIDTSIPTLPAAAAFSLALRRI